MSAGERTITLPVFLQRVGAVSGSNRSEGGDVPAGLVIAAYHRVAEVAQWIDHILANQRAAGESGHAPHRLDQILLQIALEERRQLIERNEVDPIIKIDMASSGNDDQFLGLTGELISLLAEFPGVRIGPSNEQHRMR